MRRLLFVALAIVACDQWLKWYVAGSMPAGGFGPYSILGIDASLTYVTNKGSAWGLFASYPVLLLCLRLALIVFLSFLFVRHRARRVPLIFVIAGALSNVVDMVMRGHVIDMLSLDFWGYRYPVFNIADCAICVGIGALLIVTARSRDRVAAGR